MSPRLTCVGCGTAPARLYPIDGPMCDGCALPREIELRVWLASLCTRTVLDGERPDVSCYVWRHLPTGLLYRWMDVQGLDDEGTFSISTWWEWNQAHRDWTPTTMTLMEAADRHTSDGVFVRVGRVDP